MVVFFPEFGAELPLDNCTPTIILNNPVYRIRICAGKKNTEDLNEISGMTLLVRIFVWVGSFDK